MNSVAPKGHHLVRWAIAAVVGAVVLVVGGTFVYIHFVEGKAPAKFHLSTTNPTTGSSGTAPANGSIDSASSSVEGTWKVAAGSRAGYRINEILFGQTNTAVGRTSAIIGAITVSGTSVTKGNFTVDMTTVSSDRSQRDGQFQGRIMQTSTFPTSTFILTRPIELGSVPADGKTITVNATGDLTLHGATRSVTFPVSAQRSSSGIQVTGSIAITFADWKISSPSFGPVTTDDHGALEFLFNLSKA